MLTNTMSSLIFGIALLVVLGFETSVARDIVPVFIWGNQNSPQVAVNPFDTTSQTDFEQILNKSVEGSKPILVFYQSNVCIEDIRMHKGLNNLKKYGSVEYFPSVESALDILQNLPGYNITILDSPDTITDRQIILNEIDDLDTVVETYNTIKDSNPNLVGILTGKSCKYSASDRIKRSTGNDTYPNIVVANDRFLLYSKRGFSISDGNETWTNLGKPKTTSVNGEGTFKTPLNLMLIFNISIIPGQSDTRIRFSFIQETPEYWTLAQVTVNEQVLKSTPTEIVFPFHFSYHCSEKLLFQDYPTIKLRLQIADLQLEIDAKNRTFSDSYDCIGFTTIPILSGLFVTFIIGLIVIWGLIMIMDIKTMDRFDDPKGKSITIFANE